MRTILAVSLLLGLAACDSPSNWWNGPGWYLQKPHVMITGKDVYAGPMTYDDCELARKKEVAAERLLCLQELKAPERGF